MVVCRFSCCRYFVPNPSAAGKKKQSKSSSNASSRRSSAAGRNSSMPSSGGSVAQSLSNTAHLRAADSTASSEAQAAEAAGVMVRVSVAGSTSQGGVTVVEEDVPQELELLKGINAFATPGNLVALMGGSGAPTTADDVTHCAVCRRHQTLSVLQIAHAFYFYQLQHVISVHLGT